MNNASKPLIFQHALYNVVRLHQYVHCPECKTGIMRDTGSVNTVRKLRYLHRCDTCTFQHWFDRRYPVVIEEEILRP